MSEKTIWVNIPIWDDKILRVPAKTTVKAGTVLGSMGSDETAANHLICKAVQSDAEDGSAVPRYVLGFDVVNESESASADMQARVITGGVVKADKLIFIKDGDTLETNNNVEKLKENGIFVITSQTI